MARGNNMRASPTKVMLVDDNPADIELTKDALEEGKVRLSIVTAADGQDALEQLDATLSRGEQLPNLILLDLNE